MTISKIFKTLTLATLLTLSGNAAADLLTDIQKSGVMKVGMATFVPWAMRDKDGELIGFEIDVATKLAEDLGVEVQFVPTAWSGIIPALLAKKFDLIIGGMSITPQRNLTVNFTEPYAHSGQQMAASTQLSKGFDSIDEQSLIHTLRCRRSSLRRSPRTPEQ